MYKFYLTVLSFSSLLKIIHNQPEQSIEFLLKGTMLCSEENSNLIKYAFDGNINTQFMTQEKNGWVGINILEQVIITKIEWAQKEEDHSNYLLGIFEASNTKTFEDAIPLYMIKTVGKIGEINTVNINFNKRFKFIRYVGPEGKHCIISVLNIYGYLGSESDSKYYQPTNIPLFIIHSNTGFEPEDKDDVLNCNFYVINNNKIEIKNGGTLKLKGIESLKYDKKPYNVVFENEQQPLNFISKSKKWALLGNFGDKTLIRNLLSFEISRIFNNSFTVECSPVDLMINGHYKGLYHLCDKIEVSEYRVNIKKLSNNDISGGYMLEVDGFAYLGYLYFNSRKGIPVTIKYPDVDEISSEQKNYIRDKFNELEFEVYNNNLTNIDITSFAKFFLIEELIGNAEAYWSTFLCKEKKSDKFYFGPIWDSDMTFDNDNRVYPINCKKDYIFNHGLAAGTMDRFINHIIKNDIVINEIKQLWKEITESELNINDLINFIDEKVKLMNESINLNFMKWDILDKIVNFNPRIYHTYEEEVNYVKDFVKNRINWLSNYILGTKYEVKADCQIIEENVTKNGIIYEIDNSTETVGFDYQLLSFSSFHLKISSIFIFGFFIIIF